MQLSMLMRAALALSILLATAAASRAQATDLRVGSGDAVFRLADARGKFVALHFLLKTECPVCQKTVAEYWKQGPSVAGVVHVFIKPDSDEEVRAWSAKLRESGVAATIYRDADAKLAAELKIADGYEFHNEKMHYPALVLFNPEGKEVFRHVGKSNNDRVPFDQFSRKVAELSTSKAAGQFLLEGGVALKGHDPVSYFSAGKPVVGKNDVASIYRGVTYRFANEESRRTFAADPDKFAPAYGGWCATAMAEGRKVEVDPANFKITNGRLFLFYKGWLGDALKDWNKDEPGLTRKADDAWRKTFGG